jgi:phosphoglucomutase
MTHPLAGRRPEPGTLVKREDLESAYRSPAEPLLPIKNGTSGHRGRTGSAFSERHVAAMTQALVDVRSERGTFGPADSDDPAANLRGRFPGPVVLGKDVRYTSDFAEITAVEVFAGNGTPVVVHRGGRATPTPVVSHTILAGNAAGSHVEGAILTASHNPPDDAGYKTNGLDGGPNTRTRPIDERANRLLADPTSIRRMDYGRAVREGLVIEADLVGPYVRDLAEVVDFEPLRGVRFAATPLGGSANGYYEAAAAMHDLDLQVVVREPDPASANRTYDWDGRLRGDPSSPWVMKAVEGLRESLGVPFLGANDNDADRFGGEDAGGVLAPNHVLCVLFDYLCTRRGFPAAMGVGRTIGTTHLLDRIAEHHGRPVHEVDVGFKWYVRGLLDGRYVLAGEESAGLSVPRRDGRPWVTEKDGIAAVLLVREAIARTGKDVTALYRELEGRFGVHRYERVDSPATADRKRRLAVLSADRAEVERRLAGKRVAGRTVERLVVGDGIKVVLEGGVWVLKRASGTEDIIKDYREERGETLDTARKASEEIDRLLFG